MNKKILIWGLALAIFLPACSTGARNQSETSTLRIAALPIIDTLPMYVALQEGLFSEQGINVELVPVASAPERVQLVTAGQVDGVINETLVVMLFNQETIQLQVVRYALRPTPGHGHFFILASGESGITDVEGLKRVQIGVSEGTVIEYVTDRLLQDANFSSDEIRIIAVPRISDRMSLLATGELKAGVMPDPLASLAVQQGSVNIIDDSNYPEYGFSVISFRKEVIDNNPDAVRSFLAAIEEATVLVNDDPEKYKSILSEQGILPSNLQDTYQIPPFPTAGVPSESEWTDAMLWLQEKGLLNINISYSDSVNPSLLPDHD
ncbi:MAG: ABC transporter substrate-binding protein [Anaerolineales bacterium]|nr:ABC transporter substrate-binding protein [Anaerolineales bacterium]